MTNSYEVQQRVSEIYRAYQDSGLTDSYKIKLIPLNGSGDVKVMMSRGTARIKDLISTEVKKERIIRKGEDLEFIQRDN